MWKFSEAHCKFRNISHYWSPSLNSNKLVYWWLLLDQEVNGWIIHNTDFSVISQSSESEFYRYRLSVKGDSNHRWAEFSFVYLLSSVWLPLSLSTSPPFPKYWPMFSDWKHWWEKVQYTACHASTSQTSLSLGWIIHSLLKIIFFKLLVKFCVIWYIWYRFHHLLVGALNHQK